MVAGEGAAPTVGGGQYWYSGKGFIPPGACGAATASNVLAYLLRARPELCAAAADPDPHTSADDPDPHASTDAPDPHSSADDLGPHASTAVPAPEPLAVPMDGPPMEKAGYLEFMKKVYRFMYPRAGGLMSGDFLEGIDGLASEYGLPIAAERLVAPIAKPKRPSVPEVAAFVRCAFEADSPVAFLILSSAFVENLDTWHWVTILALDEEAGRVKIVDNCEVLWADLSAWLDKSIMGGSFVRLKVL